MSENNSEKKKKSSFRDVILIVGIVVVCFALTVYAIYYLFGVAMKPQDEFGVQERPIAKEVTDPLADNTPISITDNVTDNANFAATVNTIPTTTEPEVKPVERPKASVAEPKRDEPKRATPPAEKTRTAEPKKEETKKPAEKPKSATPATKPVETATKGEPSRVYSENVEQSSVNRGKFVLQLMALRSEEDAYKAMDKFRVACSDVYVVRADLKENGVWYRVRCGITDSMDDALKLKHTLANDYKVNADIIKNR